MDKKISFGIFSMNRTAQSAMIYLSEFKTKTGLAGGFVRFGGNKVVAETDTLEYFSKSSNNNKIHA